LRDHLKSKKHPENDHDQTAKPIRHTKLCEKCNVNVRPTAWDAHLKGESHLSNKPDKSRILCKICNIEMRSNNWPTHLKSKSHLENNPDETIEPVRPIRYEMPTRLCEKCNVEIPLAHSAWFNHIKSKTHLENKPDKSRILCEIRNLEIEKQGWTTHLKSKTHQENDPDQTAKPFGQARLCEKCNVIVVRNAWDAHLRVEGIWKANLANLEKYVKNVMLKLQPLADLLI
jgi:hypothetical protein